MSTPLDTTTQACPDEAQCVGETVDDSQQQPYLPGPATHEQAPLHAAVVRPPDAPYEPAWQGPVQSELDSPICEPYRPAGQEFGPTPMPPPGHHDPTGQVRVPLKRLGQYEPAPALRHASANPSSRRRGYAL